MFPVLKDACVVPMATVTERLASAIATPDTKELTAIKVCVMYIETEHQFKTCVSL